MTGLDELRQALSAEADDVCSGAELLERVPPARRSSRRRVVAAVAAGVAIAATVSVVLAMRPDSTGRPGATSHSSSQSTAAAPTARLRTVGLSFGAHVDVPASWYSARYRGIPGTLGSPDWYLSTAPLDPACTIRSPQSCSSPNWFPARWQPPDSGALMLWATYEDPVAARVVFRNLPGHRTTLDGRPAKLYQGAPTDSCPTNTYRELDAYVQRGRLDSSSPRFQLTACFGRAATTQIRSSVLAMVRSFRIGN